VDTKSSLELPEWLDSTAYRNHRDSVEYCYENGWISGLTVTLQTFFESWCRNELVNYPGIELAEADGGYLAPHENGEEINSSNLYERLSDERDLDSEFSLDGPAQILEDLQQLRNAACHRPGYFESEPLDQDSQFNDYTGDGDIETSPEEVIDLYEEIIGLSEEDSITGSELGCAETAFYPEEKENEFYSQPQIDESLQASNSETNPTGINHLNAISSGMYHSIGHPNLNEMNRSGYTTRYNPAQPASAIIMYNWFENRLPEMIEEEYTSQDLNTEVLPDGEPQVMNQISLDDWISEDIISQIDLLPSSAHPNALENPRERLEELGNIRDNLAHNMNSYGNIDDIELRDTIWHGYEIMHLMSDRTGYTTNEFELFGEEAEQQRRSRPYMTSSERLTSWPTT
jgi:hypothetical protein